MPPPFSRDYCDQKKRKKENVHLVEIAKAGHFELIDRPRASLKIGRQDLQHGEGTLLDVRDLNVRQSFDGIKLILRPKNWQVAIFAMRPALSIPGLFDDYPDHTQTLWSVYGVTSKHLPRFIRQLDAYYLGLDRKFAQFAQGSGRDQGHTVRSLIHGGKGDFSYVVEVDLQFGKFGSGNIPAWKYAQGLSYSFSPSQIVTVHVGYRR